MNDTSLVNSLQHTTQPDILLLPREYWQEAEISAEEAGWWYRVRQVIRCKKCPGCGTRKTLEAFSQPREKGPTACAECQGEGEAHQGTCRKRKKRRLSQTVKRRTGPTRAAKKRRIHYKDHSTSEGDAGGDEGEEGEYDVCLGVLLTTADPRYVGLGNDKKGGDVVMDVKEVRELLRRKLHYPAETSLVWLTTGQMGWALVREAVSYTHLTLPTILRV